jgi:hypothetical protein
VVRLRPKPGAAAVPLVPQVAEIAEARWFTIDEFRAKWPDTLGLYDLLNRSGLESEACLEASLKGLTTGALRRIGCASKL